MWYNLPEEVIAEIFCKLPIKSILRCISVCKSWNCLIKNPNFIFTHLHKTKNQLLLHRVSINSAEQHYILRFNNKDLREYMPVTYPFNAGYYFNVAGSCNGLVFLYNDSRYICIFWNPSLRKYLKIPQPNSLFPKFRPRSRSFIGLGFDFSTNDYKLLRIMNCPAQSEIGIEAQFKAEVYSLNLNSWKDITDIAPRKFDIGQHVVPAFVNGALHWPVTYWNRKFEPWTFVMVFDLKNEVFGEIMLPECLVNFGSSNIIVKAYGDSSIAVISDRHSNNNPYPYDDNQTHIWVMKDYGVAGSWVKLATLGKRWRGRSMVLGLRNNGEVLMELSRGRIASHNPQTQKINNLIIVENGHSYVYSHMESLALLDKGNSEGIETNTSSPSM